MDKYDLTKRCDDLLCENCPFKGIKLLCDMARNTEETFGNIIKNMKNTLNLIEQRINNNDN